MNSRFIAGLCAAILAAGHIATAPAAELTADMVTNESVIGPVTAHRTVKIGATDVRYTATFAETLLSRDGKPQATLGSTSYIREDVENPDLRPVLFAFNGGPGASSSPLHFGSLGPRRWAENRDVDAARQIVENPYSLIDVADLVFIDPVGTGFSRARPDGNPAPYWSIEGDARAVIELIRGWLHEHGRMHSPVFIAGESYGGFRLAVMAKELEDLPIAGLIFVSPLLDASAAAETTSNDLAYVFSLPSFAATAWYHEKIDRKGRSVAQLFDEATRFAQSEYLVALQQGSILAPASRKNIAARVAAYTGLPVATVEAANLRIGSQEFLDGLLADRKLVVGRVDTRVTGPAAPPKDPTRPRAADDPALGLKGSNVIRSTAIKSYFERELGVVTNRDYLSLTLEVNFRWDWSASPGRPQFYFNPTPNLAALMTKRPALQVLLLGGYFDLATPLNGPRHALTHAGLPMSRVAMHAFEGGHSPFDGEPQLKRMSSIVHTFVRPPGR